LGRQISETLGLLPTLLKSNNGLYLLLPAASESNKHLVHAGPGPALYKLYITATGPLVSLEGGRTISVPRTGLGTWTAQCPAGDVHFKELSRDEARQRLPSLKLRGPLWQREPLALARDDRGVYYYVDKLHNGLGYRLFKGPRGRLALTAMVDIVDDASGKIFATKKGKLRLVIGGKEARWIEGKRSKKLTLLDTRANRALIYNQLGVYEGQQFGGICDLEQLAAQSQ